MLAGPKGRSSTITLEHRGTHRSACATKVLVRRRGRLRSTIYPVNLQISEIMTSRVIRGMTPVCRNTKGSIHF